MRKLAFPLSLLLLAVVIWGLYEWIAPKASVTFSVVVPAPTAPFDQFAVQIFVDGETPRVIPLQQVEGTRYEATVSLPAHRSFRYAYGVSWTWGTNIRHYEPEQRDEPRTLLLTQAATVRDTVGVWQLASANGGPLRVEDVRPLQLTLFLQFPTAHLQSVADVDAYVREAQARWVAFCDSLRLPHRNLQSGPIATALAGAPLEAPDAAYRYLLAAYQLPALREEVALLRPAAPENLRLLLSGMDVLRPVAHLGLPPAHLETVRTLLDSLAALAPVYRDLPGLGRDDLDALDQRFREIEAMRTYWPMLVALHAGQLETAAHHLEAALRQAEAAQHPLLHRVARRLALLLSDAGRSERALSVLSLIRVSPDTPLRTPTGPLLP